MTNTKTGSIAVNIVPHILSASFSKPSIIDNGADTATLTATVLDYNGCSDLQGGSSAVTADLSGLGGSATAALSYVSCAGDGVTATFSLTGISTTVSSGPQSVHLTAKDAENNANGSDANFTAGDL